MSNKGPTLKYQYYHQSVLSLGGLEVERIHEVASSSEIRCVEKGTNNSDLVLGFKDGHCQFGRFTANSLNFRSAQSWRSVSSFATDWVLVVKDRYIITNDYDGCIEFRTFEGILLRKLDFYGFLLHLPKSKTFLLVPDIKSSEDSCWSLSEDADIKSVNFLAHNCIPHLVFGVAKAIATSQNTVWMSSFTGNIAIYDGSSFELKTKFQLNSTDNYELAWCEWDGFMVLEEDRIFYLYDMDGKFQFEYQSILDSVITELCVWKDVLCCGDWNGNIHFLRRTSDSFQMMCSISFMGSFICSMKVLNGMLFVSAGKKLYGCRGDIGLSQLIFAVQWSWNHIRLLWIGFKDSGSVLSTLPKELIKCIIQMMHDNPFGSVVLPTQPSHKKRKRTQKTK